MLGGLAVLPRSSQGCPASSVSAEFRARTPRRCCELCAPEESQDHGLRAGLLLRSVSWSHSEPASLARSCSPRLQARSPRALSVFGTMRKGASGASVSRRQAGLAGVVTDASCQCHSSFEREPGRRVGSLRRHTVGAFTRHTQVRCRRCTLALRHVLTVSTTLSSGSTSRTSVLFVFIFTVGVIVSEMFSRGVSFGGL